MRRRERRERHERDQHVHDDDAADRAEQAPRQVAPGPAHFLGVVRDRLEAGVREHRERQRERDLMPRRRRPERRAVRERAAGEQQREAEDDEEDLRDEIEQRNGDAEAVEPRAAREPRERDEADDDAADDHVPRMTRDRVDPERDAEVVREEERGERDDDEVVEEEDPAGDEAGEVVERDPHEGGGAAGLADRGRALGIRQRDDEEEHPDHAEHSGGEPEGVERDDAEGEVDRGGDLAVRHRREGRRVERPLQVGKLAGHARRSLAPPQEVDTPDAERDEEDTEHDRRSRRRPRACGRRCAMPSPIARRPKTIVERRYTDLMPPRSRWRPSRGTERA